jgi:hypothetical protein
LVPPGDYTVRLKVGAAEIIKTIKVEDDLRIALSPEDRAKRTRAITELFDMAKESDQAQRAFTALRTALTNLKGSQPEAAAKAVADLLKKMDAIQRPAPDQPLDYVTPPISQRISRLLNAVDAYALVPTQDQLTQIRELHAEMTPKNEAMHQVVTGELAELNRQMNLLSVPHIALPDPPRR